MADPTSVITGPHGPASVGLIAWLKSIFGKAFTVSRGYSSQHDGIDLPAKEGTPVRALSSGIVSYARDARRDPNPGANWAIGAGNVVNIDIGGSLTTQYAHLKSISVKEGQRVQAGQIIGTVGRTGGLLSSGQQGGPGSLFPGAHLHFGLWDKAARQMINPQKYFENLGDTSTNMLGGWADQVQFEEGHILTAEDIDYIMDVLNRNDWFKGNAGAEGSTRAILKTFIGSAWTKETQGKIQEAFYSAAESAGDPFGIQAGLGGLGVQIADTVTWIGLIILGVVLIGGGIYLLKPSQDT